MNDEHNNRIKHAAYSEVFSYGENRSVLFMNSQTITPAEYDHSYMSRKIFCLACTAPLIRRPQEKEFFSNGRGAHFCHHRSTEDVSCPLKVPKAKGLNYKNSEEASRAIESEDLVVINEWMNEPGELSNELNDEEYSRTPVEDADGPETEMPLARHTGETMRLPSQISSVLSLCKRFDWNLYRAFYFPHSQYPVFLNDALVDASKLNETDEEPHLFYGKVTYSGSLDYKDKIEIENDFRGVFKIYPPLGMNARKFGSASVRDRIVLFYGNVRNDSGGTPSCFIDRWGAYALLPEKYRSLIEVI